MNLKNESLTTSDVDKAVFSWSQFYSRAWGGGVLFVVSIVFVIGGMNLGLGSPLRLGTGAFPFVTGLILAILAIAICFYETRGKEVEETPDWVGLIAICSSLAVFAVMAERLGLVPAAFSTVVIASLPDRSLSLLGKVILGCCVAVVCWVLFIEALSLPFKPFIGF